MNWTAEYYRNADGKEPAAEFINSLPKGARAKVFRTIKLLKDYGVLLKEPYSKQIKGKIRELRIKGSQGSIKFYILPIQADGLFSCTALSKRLIRHPLEILKLQKKE